MSAGLGELVESTTKSTELFIEKYYDLLDGKSSSVVGSVGNNNVERLIAMYNGNARISWNGNPIPSSDLATFLFNLPKSIHQVQAFDSHPISGSSGTKTSIVVTVTGSVTHGNQPPPSILNSHPSEFEWLPRVFSQSFILVCDSSAINNGQPSLNNNGEVPYVISADSFRFVG